MTINTLLIPPDDPQGHPFIITRKPGPAYPPVAIQNRFYLPQKSIFTAPTQGTTWTHYTLS